MSDMSGSIQTTDGDTRTFPGLPEDHPVVGNPCLGCGWPLRPGDVTKIFAPQPDTVEDARRAEAGLPYTSVGNGLCHDDCERAHEQLRDVLLGSPRCVLCGCTQSVACDPPCAWAPGHAMPVCTSCESADWGMPLQRMLDARGPRPQDEFTLEIRLGNDAMRTRMDIAAALHDTAKSYLDSGDADEGIIRDANGNTVGGWTLTLTPEQEEDHG